MKTAFHPDMPNAVYHAADGVSKTTLDLIHQDPFSVDWARHCPQDEDKLKTLDFGDAMHAICLEPERLKTEFIAEPVFKRRTNAGKADAAAFAETHKDKKIITADEYKKLELMFESVMAYAPGRDLIEAEGFAESSWFWTDPITGLRCKCRPDKFIESRGVLVDVKTTDSLAKFHFSADDYRYYVQDPWYCDGLGHFGHEVEMIFLVIQKTIELGRYPVRLYRLPPEAIEYGRLEYRQDLNAYADFLEHGHSGEPIEIPMSFRFMERAMEATTEVLI